MTRKLVSRFMVLIPVCLLTFSLASCSKADNSTSATPTLGNDDPDLAKISLPQGFSISYYAESVPGARSLTQGENGTVFVGTRGSGVYALRDIDNEQVADSIYIIADNLNTANGLAFCEGELFGAEVSRVLRFGDM